MAIPFQEDEEEENLSLDDLDPTDDDFIDIDEDLSLEVTLDDIEILEEKENTGHKIQTFDRADDGTDDYFDEQYFDE